jgi:EARP and GARP complex-interacting protein 1
MEENNPVIYGLEFQSRALTSQGPVSNDNVVFYVATQSLKPNNQIHKILINEEEKVESQVK